MQKTSTVEEYTAKSKAKHKGVLATCLHLPIKPVRCLLVCDFTENIDTPKSKK